LPEAVSFESRGHGWLFQPGVTAFLSFAGGMLPMPVFTSAFFTHSLSVCAQQPILAATDETAAQRELCHDRKPAALRERGLQVKICSSSCLS
jgi:hypothetical protein